MADIEAPAQAIDNGQAKEDLNSQSRSAGQLMSYLRLYRYGDTIDYVAIFLGVVGSLLNAPTMPLFAYVFGEVLDTFYLADNPDKITRDIRTLTFWFVGLGIVTLIASFLEVGMFMWSGARQVSGLRERYLQACLNQEQAYYDTEATSGNVLSGLNEDCQAVQNAIGEKVGNAIHHVGCFLVSIAISLWRGWKLALLMLALTPLIGMAGAILAKIMTMGEAKMAEGYAKANVQSSQAISNMRTVASFRAEPSIFEKYTQLLQTPTKVQTRISTMGGLAGGFVNCVVFLTYGAAFLYGGKLTRDATPNCNPDDKDCYTAGTVMTVIFANIIGGFSLGQAAPNFPAFTAGIAAGRRIFKVLDRKPLIDVNKEGIVPERPLVGNVEMRGVHFAYPARPDVAVFRGLDFTVTGGQTVALVGASGSGKSSVIQLLQRFYDPEKGKITIDGYELRELDLGWYRSQVGFVSQEPTLFATSIRENIAMGHDGATEKEIQNAAVAANAHSFISKLPEGYKTQVGERGVQLSGGQKQRVAIARALLKNPNMLLLDEATSALDTVSERLVQQALERLASGRTTIVVAHRLSTIRGADKIAVDGFIVEEGTHDELFSRENSAYHSLVKLQEHATEKRIEGGLEQAQDIIPAGGQPSAQQLSSKRLLEDRHGSSKKNLDNGEKEDELTEEEKATKVSYLRLLKMVKGEWYYIALGVAASAVLGCVMPLFAVILSDVISRLDPMIRENGVLKKQRYSKVVEVAVGFFGLGFGMLLFAFIQGVCFAIVGARLAERVRRLFFKAVLSMEIAWFDRDENTSGALASRLSADAPRVRGAVADTMGILVQNATTIIVAYIIAFVNDWRMTLVITAVIPLLIFASIMQMKFFTGLDNKGGRFFAMANQTANEGIAALRTVHSYNMQNKVVRIYSSMLKGPARRSKRNSLNSGLAFGAGQCILFLFYALAFWYGGRLIVNGDLTATEMLKAFFALLLASMGISQAQLLFPDVSKGKSAVARVFRVVDRKTLIDATSDTGDKLTGGSGAVRLHNVDFSYPTRPDVPVFRNFTLDIAAGKVTALVGESGSGKSTIVSLIERFYDVQKGQVLLDGVDVRQLSLPWLRDQVGLVSQEPALFNGTILENVKLGKPDATDAEIAAACEVANAIEFITRQPDHYNTLLGEGGGITLSGGQKQRIAIARAVLKNPRVLLLDEATSALDAESERVVQDALNKLMVGRTSVVIAHRLTTIRDADNIAVVQSGVVLEQGTHDQLMAKGGAGAYVKLARAQAGA